MELKSRSVAVVGGGITGLAAAHRLCELDPTLQVRLLEAAPRLGGVIETAESSGFLNEHSADSFITNVPWALDLCRRVGLGDELLETNAGHRQAFVVRAGKLHKVPPGFLLMAPSQMWPILTTPLLSLRGKLRLLAEFFIPAKRDVTDESLGSFVRRRLGSEAFDRLVQPLIGGIYTADPEKLSLRATMPRFLDMERDAGSLIRGTLRDAAGRRAAGSSSGARYSLFATPRHGLGSLVEAIARRLPPDSVQLGTSVEQIERSESRWRLGLKRSDGQATAETFDAVIVATPAYRAATLLQGVDADLAADLSEIEYAGSAVISVVYRRAAVEHPLDGFGFVVPAIEGRRILSASFSSVKFAGRAGRSGAHSRFRRGRVPGRTARSWRRRNNSDCHRRTALADRYSRRARVLSTASLASLDAAVSPGALRAGRSVSNAARPPCQDWRWPATPITASAFRNCIHSGELAAERIASATGGRITRQTRPGRRRLCSDRPNFWLSTCGVTAADGSAKRSF